MRYTLLATMDTQILGIQSRMVGIQGPLLEPGPRREEVKGDTRTITRDVQLSVTLTRRVTPVATPTMAASPS